MSQKVTSKNLSYNSSLPPFLAALRAQAGGGGGGGPGPDPILANQRRSAKKRSSSEEAEDAPLIVDEHGNAMNVVVGKDGEVRERDAADPAADDDNDDGDACNDGASKGADSERAAGKAGKQDGDAKFAFGGRKRKVGKVVGDSKADDEDEPPVKDTRRADSKDGREPERTAEKKAKKKVKKIKLSFDEDEG
ncbi:hypothetical protein JDV02_008766 [Purpureocillium takamizusanense]|uniref:DUF4604 domain-containing protein n=1 Tax=Purpureocillium takamizusanense TaxID=2060973 RepID=A0A9Q8VFL6_9HYPO|nr:uncharacterized protein JDV02_008766 [Purpureocillium takamizusanense]UNI22922.1 hypothetical protein JDV02_008766 [Purpureocillium takamizusanense]